MHVYDANLLEGTQREAYDNDTEDPGMNELTENFWQAMERGFVTFNNLPMSFK